MEDFAIADIDKVIIDSFYFENLTINKKQYVIDYMNRVDIYEKEGSLFLKIKMEICTDETWLLFIQKLKDIVMNTVNESLDTVTIYYNITRPSGKEEMRSICFKDCKFAKKEILHFDSSEITNFDLVYKITNSNISYY